jgi:biopolymer transport protein ExbD
MRFTVKRRRQPPPVIIISLIDILMVLLIFVMVTTTFRDQPAVRLVLPESKQKPKPGATDSAVIVTVTKQSPPFYFGKVPVTLDKLTAELNAAVEKNPQVSLAIRADTEAQFGQVVRVIDAGTAAQIKSFSYFLQKAIEP